MIKLALPAGELRPVLADVLAALALRVQGYGEGSRSYRLDVPSRDGVRVRVFREKDIPIQVALGNYDLGVCSLAWVREMQARFPEQPVAPLGDLKIGASGVYVAAATGEGFDGLARLPAVRLASEYANLAEAVARACRFPRYRIQTVWGAAEAYPPEDADVVVLSAPDEETLRQQGLTPLFRLLDNSAWVVANAASLASKDLSAVLPSLLKAVSANGHGRLRLPPPIASVAPAVVRRDVAEAFRPPVGRLKPSATLGRGRLKPSATFDQRVSVRMAVPDGHQQRHAFEALRAAGLAFEGYGEKEWVRRPASPIEGLEVKVIRPHDMPQLVATGELDLAITGRDCLNEHKYNFPSSPVEEALDLRRGDYNLSVVASMDLPAGGIDEALDHWRSRGKNLVTLAAELPATADHYARSRHFWRYQIIPIAGASEGFVPEDADLLIEGTETGRTIAENNLKIIDNLYRSTTCVIAPKGREISGRRRQIFDDVLSALREAARSRL